MSYAAKQTTVMLVAVLLSVIPATGPHAQQKAAAGIGPVTHLPLPRFVSMKASKANARRGPGTSQKVDWVFLKKHTPLEITAEYGHWRRVRDADGAGGWMHYALLSGVRTVLVLAEKATLREAPEDAAAPVAMAEKGVIARLGACVKLWCEVSAGGLDGWVKKTAIWGVGAEEIRK